MPLEHRELMAQDEDFDVLGSVAADSQAPSKATALRTSGRSASALSADHVGLAWATMQQVNGCEHHFGHQQVRGPGGRRLILLPKLLAATVGRGMGIPPAHSMSRSSMLSGAGAHTGDHARQLRCRVGAPDLIRAVVIDAFSARIAAAGSCSAGSSRGTSPA